MEVASTKAQTNRPHPTGWGLVARLKMPNLLRTPEGKPKNTLNQFWFGDCERSADLI
jgi:hypothetical protein